MLVIPATLAEVATPETMGQQAMRVTAERAATAEAEARAGAFRAVLAVTPAVVQVTLL
jgi:ribosomal protein L9